MATRKKRTTYPFLLMITLATFSSLSFMLSPVVGAQGSDAEQARSSSKTSAFSETDLKAFASAYVEVAKIYTATENKLKNVEDPQRANRLQKEANSKMNAAVEAEGLSTQTYNNIFQATQEDEDLRQYVNTLINEQQ